MKLPNILTLIRFFLIPIILRLLYSLDPRYVLLSLNLFIFAFITDFFDGYIARKYNQQSVFGTFFDPLVDKLIVLSLFFAFSDLGVIALWIPLLFLFRELFVTGIRQVASTKNKIVGANWMGKSKGVLYLFLIAYIYFYIYLDRLGIEIVVINQFILNLFAYLVLIVVWIYAFIFFYWHKEGIIKDI